MLRWVSVKIRAVAVMLVAPALLASERRFTASDVPHVRVGSRIAIRNDVRSITAYRFFGNVREALFSLRTSRRVAVRPFGNVVYDPSGALRTPLPPHVAVLIREAARAHGVDPRLVAAVARRESAFHPRAVSPAGASGVMQLMPATARFLGVTDVFDARQNIFGGTRYLRSLLETFDGDLDLALAAYNAGPGAVEKYNGVPPYRETRSYVAAIRAEYERALRD